MKKLKPCPFCGGEANMLSCDKTGSYVSYGIGIYMGREMTHKIVRCEKCGIRTKHYATSKGAFNAWNRRANDDKADC